MDNKTQIKHVVESQQPQFIRESYQDFITFLKSYYKSLEYKGGPVNILNNINEYAKLQNISEIVYDTKLSFDLPFDGDIIEVLSTIGFPQNNSFIKIGDEIIFYESKTETKFLNCKRGFSGVTSYDEKIPIFNSSLISDHKKDSIVYNINALFLLEIYKKFKAQYTPGFEEVNFFGDLNENILISRIKDFYSSRGSDVSFDLLFKIIWGVSAKVIKPRDFLIQASDADYRIFRDLVIERYEGNPLDIENRTLFQDVGGIIGSSFGTIVKVEQIFRGDNEYFIMSLDYNPEIEEFSFEVHSKTKTTDDAIENQTYLDVDSTLGFAPSGTLVFYSNGVRYFLEYSEKNSTQFLGLKLPTNIPVGTNIFDDNYAYVIVGDEQIKVKITGVLGELNYDKESSKYYLPGDNISVVSLGKNSNKKIHNSWSVNQTPEYDVLSLFKVSQKLNGVSQYRITTYDETILKVGDRCLLISNSGEEYNVFVIAVISKTISDINISSNLDTSKSYIIKRKVSKVSTIFNPELNIISSDVSNVYIDEDDTYVISSSLPNYYEKSLIFNKISKTFSLSLTSFTTDLQIGSHPFVSGDSIYYSSNDNTTLSISDGQYFVYKVNDATIRLASSRANIRNKLFISVSGIAVNAKFSLLKYYNKEVKPQHLIRKFNAPMDDVPEGQRVTNPGGIGMFLNGVELLNSKSSDTLYYGPLKEIIISSSGDLNYDVINPPVLEIIDNIGIPGDSGFGTDAYAICNVRGSLSRIDLIDWGFDYIEDPIITITGGNGFGAKCKCNLGSIIHFNTFNAGSLYNQVNLTNNTITFENDHKFKNYEKIVYDSTNQLEVGGLVNGSMYYVNTLDKRTINFYNSFQDSLVGINTVQFTSYGEGLQKITSVVPKKVVKSVDILEKGSNYTNKTVFFDSSNINLNFNYLEINNHGYKNKEIIIFNSDDTLPTGISSSLEYFVKVIDDNKFNICEVNADKSEFNYNNNIFVNFVDYGTGIHNISYLPISVKLEAPIGIATFSGQNLSAKIIPTFTGEIFSVSLKNKGTNYGDKTIINYNRQPLIRLLNGSDARLYPTISDSGKIIGVNIINGGSNYNSQPLLVINGSGYDAKLVPIIKNGRVDDVLILDSGRNYSKEDTTIEVISNGFGASFQPIIQSWNINLVERLFDRLSINGDDGIVTESLDINNELQYSHGFASRGIREQSLATSLDVNGNIIYKSDILNDNDTIKYHSPIIGWAYDGNPIYGPYAYDDIEGGSIRKLKSGYILKLKQNRPPQSIFPPGYFIEDYEFTNDGDLDKHNGRFCKTPEFPNGIYAYFSTFNNVKDSVGSYNGFFRPIYPYVIGPTFKSSPINYNFDILSNLYKKDIDAENWIRFTSYFGLLNERTRYRSITSPNIFTRVLTSVDSTTSGSVDKLNVIFGGENYSVGDKIIFKSQNDFGSGAYGYVTDILGKEISNVKYNFYKLENVEFIRSGYEYIGFANTYHNLNKYDVVILDNSNILSSKFKGQVGLKLPISNKLTTLSNIDTSSVTGIITYITVSGDLNKDIISVGDIYMSNSELFKILNIYNSTSTLRIEREYFGSTTTTHNYGDLFEELSRKIIINSGFTTETYYSLNEQYNFNPKESVIIPSENLLSYSYPVPTSLLPSTPWSLASNVSGTVEYFEKSPISNKNTAVKVSFGSTIGNLDIFALTYTTVSLSNQDNTLSVNLKGENGGESVYLIIDNGLSFYHQLVTLSNDWRRYSLTANTSSGPHNIRVGAYGPEGLTLNQSPVFYASDFQLESGSIPSTYYETFNTILTRSENKSGSIYINNSGLGIISLSDIPVNTLFLPNHKFNLNDNLIYDCQSGSTGIKVSYASTVKSITDINTLYAVPYNSNFVGLSTQKVGIGSTQTFVGFGTESLELFKFIDYGFGDNHILKTNNPNVLTADVYKKYATIETEEEHNLQVGDFVDVRLLPNVTSTIKIVYNDFLERMLVNPVNFLSTDIDLNNNFISILNHNFKNGEKVVYNSQNPSSGLINSGIYYIIVINKDTIGLTSSYYNEITSLDRNIIINIGTKEDGTLSSINPELILTKNKKVKFDLSSITLQFNDVSSFKFNLYYDSNFNYEYYRSSEDNISFNVINVGEIGFDGAYLELTLDDDTPDSLFYNLIPVNLPTTPSAKLRIKSDPINIINSNKITISESIFNVKTNVTGITSTTFDYSLVDTPEKTIYNKNNGIFKYSTSSIFANGAIDSVKLESGGRNYRSLPYITEVYSETGNKAIIIPESNSIGKINSVLIKDIGFDYPSDKTLKPSAIFPLTYKVEPLSKFEKIKILDFGVNYFVPPQLVVLDGFTGKLNDEVSLKYDIGDVEVTIRRNTTGLYNVTPTILPINNPNGIRISNIVYNQSEEKVTVSFAVTFSSVNDYPFKVGDSVIIENTNINLNVGGKGFNSSAYGYKLFEILESNPNIGGENPTIVYSLKNLLKSGEMPGEFDEFESFGTATPKSFFPIFDITLKKDRFKDGEVVTYQENKGIVQSYDELNENIKILSNVPFNPGDVIYGESSKNLALLSKSSGITGQYSIQSNSIVEKGWKKETGKLNTFFQRIHDNDYYQYFSYSVRSQKQFSDWNPIVSNLTHTSGFKKFSEVLIESYDPNISGISTNQNANLVTATSNLSENVDLNFVKDFDIAREKTIKVDDSLVSNEVLFNLPFLAEYKEFIGNRVLTIDNISDQFNSKNMSFYLTEKNNPIFEIIFDGGDLDKVSPTKNQINLKNHYFVSGEEVEYVPPQNNFNNAIEISPTNFPGIGITSRLPSKFYIIKDDNQKIGIAVTVGDALTFNQKRIDIINAGVGTGHKIRSIDANNRILVTINGSIQSPLVGSGITLSNINSIGVGVTNIIVDNIIDIASNDLLKIDDEIIIINSVNSQTNNLNVKRSWVGTSATSHSSNSLIQKLSGNFNIVNNTINFPEPIWGKLPVGFGTTAVSSNEIDYTGLTTSSKFSGRVFLRSALNFIYTSDFVKSYDNNYIYDDISTQFNGISTTFNLKYQGNSITDISYRNGIILIDGIFQGPQKISNQQSIIRGDYKLFNESGDLKIGFNGKVIDPSITKDINVNRVPKGGIIVSVGSTSGFGYHPLVSAGGTAVIDGSGYVISVSIGNSGSGYRSGIQTVNVGLKTDSESVRNIGYANISNGYVNSVIITDQGPNIYDQNNPPKVVFDDPLPYYNLPLVYKNGYSGIGTGAVINIVPSLNGTISSFDISNYGYGYKKGDVLTVSIGGTVGIQTLTGIPEFKNFELTVTEVSYSQFSGWNVGEFLVIDDISKFFNGVRRLFPLKLDGENISFYAKTSSGISLQSNLLVFVNDVLQTPGEGYKFNGGSRIIFTEAPKGPLVGFSTIGDTVKILVYTGTEQIDVKNVRVLPTLKIGDNVQLYSDIDSILNQEERLVMQIPSADTIITNNYADVGVVVDELYERPISWSKQTEDIIIDSKYIGKDRVYYEPIINPSTNILESVGVNSTFVYVYSTRSLFDDSQEGINLDELYEVELISKDIIEPAEAVSIIDSNGSITGITITNPGFGYTFAPQITIQKPFIDGSQSICDCTIDSNGSISLVTVSAGGTNYIYGPISDVSIISQGTGFPSIGASTNIVSKAKLKSQTGFGELATVTLTFNPVTYVIENFVINDPGINYSVGDILLVDIYDNANLDLEFRNWPLSSPVKIKVDNIIPPPVLVSPPARSLEQSASVTYQGDYGIIVGVTTSPPSGLQYYVNLDLYIPLNSRLRKYNGISQTGITTGDLFNITHSNFGVSPRTSLRLNGIDTLGISTQFSDMTLQCYDWSEKVVTIPSGLSGSDVGITTTIKSIKCIFLRTGSGDIVGIADTGSYGYYTWGKVNLPRRSKPVNFKANSGFYQHKIVTNPILRRKYPLKYNGYFV